MSADQNDRARDADSADITQDNVMGIPMSLALGTATWNYDISQAPKDRPILAWCRNDCQSDVCGYHTHTGITLCLYHGHVEGLSHVSDGPHVLVWGGGWADSSEDEGGYLPDWWFRSDSEFESVANPVAWRDIGDPFTRTIGDGK